MIWRLFSNHESLGFRTDDLRRSGLRRLLDAIGAAVSVTVTASPWRCAVARDRCRQNDGVTLERIVGSSRASYQSRAN